MGFCGKRVFGERDVWVGNCGVWEERSHSQSLKQRKQGSRIWLAVNATESRKGIVVNINFVWVRSCNLGLRLKPGLQARRSIGP